MLIRPFSTRKTDPHTNVVTVSRENTICAAYLELLILKLFHWSSFCDLWGLH